MTHALASMLDELMGRNRNVLPSQLPAEPDFADPEVCKYHLAGFCHHELFNNTKADIGFCTKHHDDKLREQYRKSDKFEKLGFEEEWLTALQLVQRDMHHRIMRNKQRLAITQGKPDEVAKAEVKIESLTDKINVLLEKAEKIGAEGRVDESQRLIEETEKLKEEREQCRKIIESPETSRSNLKEMEVCDMCGSFLVIGDAQYRIDEHLTGKQHLGFSKLKATIDELMRKNEEKRRHKGGGGGDDRRGGGYSNRRNYDGPTERSRGGRNRSRSRSPMRDPDRSRDRHGPRHFDDRRRRHHNDYRSDGNRHHRHHHSGSSHEGGRQLDRDSRSSRSSQHESDRHRHNRSRSPKRNSRDDTPPKPRSNTERSQSRDDERERNGAETAAAASTVDRNRWSVSSSEKKRRDSTEYVRGESSSRQATGNQPIDDDEDEEGLIKDD